MDDLLTTIMSGLTQGGHGKAASLATAHNNKEPVQDVFAQLAQKETDLILAAELGKALLERNEELGRQNAAMADEFSEKLEQLEQERHRLRLQIEVMEEEYEQRVSDLKADLSSLRSTLSEVGARRREDERERSALVATLTEQNQRLTVELEGAVKREEELQRRLEEMRGQFNDKRVTIRDHVQHLENLKDEINIVNSRKESLERKISDLLGEREGLSCNLDETSEKIVMMERHAREQEAQIRNSEREMTELRETNQALFDRLEAISRSFYPSSSLAGSTGMSSGGPQMSLLNELEMSSEWPNLQQQQGRRRCSQIDELQEDDDGMEEEDLEEEFDDSQMTFVDTAEMKELREEVLTVYRQIKSLSSQIIRESPTTTSNAFRHPKSKKLKRRRHSSDSMMTNSSCDSSGRGTNSCNSSSSSEEGEYSHDKAAVTAGMLTGAVQELDGLVGGLLGRSGCAGCLRRGISGSGSGRSSSAESAESAVVLDDETRGPETEGEVQGRLRQAELKVRQRNEEIEGLQSRLSMLEVQLRGVEEEREIFRQDLENSHLGKDQLIRKAWETRDEAVKRKNSAEVELARERIGIMQVNSQLLEAIQQKVELSQQLEAWQSDMEVLLEEQIRDRLVHSEKRNRKRSPRVVETEQATSVSGSTGNRFFSFFQRS